MSLPASRLCLTVPLLAFTPSNFEVVWASAAKPVVALSKPTATTADRTAKRTLRNEPIMELLLVRWFIPLTAVRPRPLYPLSLREGLFVTRTAGEPVLVIQIV